MVVSFKPLRMDGLLDSIGIKVTYLPAERLLRGVRCSLHSRRLHYRHMPGDDTHTDELRVYPPGESSLTAMDGLQPRRWE